MTCRHFRYQVPRECADELRDADPEPCPVCDALPHRKALAKASAIMLDQHDHGVGVAKSGWLVQLFGEKREEVSPTASLPVPVRAAA